MLFLLLLSSQEQIKKHAEMFIKTSLEPILAEKLRKYVYDIIGCCQAVHKEQGPELTEYIYQESLEIAFRQAGIPTIREYYFSPTFRGITLKSKMRVDFFCRDKVFVECKAIESIGLHERLQLWSYMRAAKIRIGILYNFLPVMDECEKYYLDLETNSISYF